MLGPTDVGVVQFRRLMLEAAQQVAAGREPPSVDRPRSYLVRAGGIVAEEKAEFSAVMIERFGSADGTIRDSDQPPVVSPPLT